MSWVAAAVLGGGVLGGIAGAQRNNSSQTYSKQIGPESDLEKQAGGAQGSSLTDFQNLVGAGPGMQAMKDANGSANDFASMLSQYAKGGFMPNQQDYTNAQNFTNNVFAPEQTALAQHFQDAQWAANRQAGMMGRAGNDPILMNKLLQEHTRQQAMLQSQMTSFGAQQAQQMPFQRLGFQQQLAGLHAGLATQAMANRQALLGMGSQIKQQEQNFRLGAATSTQDTSSGGGLAGGLSGALMGIGAGAGIASKFGGGAPKPASTGLATGAPTSQYDGINNG